MCKYFIPVYCWIIFHWVHISYFVYSSIDGYWVVSNFRLLWIMVLGSFMNKFLFGHKFSFLLCLHTRLECVWWLCLFFVCGIVKLFPKVAGLFYISTSSGWGFQFIYIVTISFFFLINLFIYLFLAALGLRCCARAFSSCGEGGLLFVAVHGLLIVVAALVAGPRVRGLQ